MIKVPFFRTKCTQLDFFIFQLKFSVIFAQKKFFRNNFNKILFFNHRGNLALKLKPSGRIETKIIF